MKTKVFVLLFMLLISFFAKAENNYRRDRDTCKVGEHSLNIDLRSSEQFADSEDDEYGEVLFITHNSKTIKADLRNQGIGGYRMMKLSNEFCDKILSVKSSPTEIAFFFLHDNRPYPELLTVLYYHFQDQTFRLEHTKLPAKKAEVLGNSLYVQLSGNACDIKSGSVVIKGKRFLYLEKPFEPWLKFVNNKFQLDSSFTMSKFEYKKFISTSKIEKLKDLERVKYGLTVDGQDLCFSFDGNPWQCSNDI